MTFDPQKYWEKRLSADYSLTGVGRLNSGMHWNRWLYRVRRAVFMRLVRSLRRDIAGARILDVGSGTGFYVERWIELGTADVLGADITKTAVDNLRRRFPQQRFVEMNIGANVDAIRDIQFDFISSMDVMFHIVDDAQYARALLNMATALKPDGYLVFSDLFLHAPARRFEHVAHRPLDMIEVFCRDAGLEVVGRRPMFVLMNEPVDSGNIFLKLNWGILDRILRRANGLGRVFGAMMYPLEIALTGVVRESPATEIMICRKAGGGDR